MPSAIVAYTGPTNHRRLSEAFELDRRFWTPRGPNKARALERWQEAAEVSPLFSLCSPGIRRANAPGAFPLPAPARGPLPSGSPVRAPEVLLDAPLPGAVRGVPPGLASGKCPFPFFLGAPRDDAHHPGRSKGGSRLPRDPGVSRSLRGSGANPVRTGCRACPPGTSDGCGICG